MLLQNNTARSLFLLVFMLPLCMPSLLWGQRGGKEYSGLIKVGKYVGVADFEYRKQRKDTVLNGRFEMEGSNIDSIWSSDINYFSFQGEYESNKLNGDWAFRLGELSSSNEVELVDYQLHAKVSGTMHDINLKSKNGRLQGLASHHIYKIEGSEVKETLFKGSLAYERGIPNGGFCIEDSTVILDGIFSKEGLADGLWILRKKQPKEGEQWREQWQFANGRPQRVTHVRGDSQTVQKIDNFQSSTQVFQPLPVSEKFFQILDLQQRLRQADPIRGGLKGLILKNEAFLEKQNGLIADLGGDISKSQTKFSLPYFPLAKQEQFDLDTVELNIERAEEMIRKLQGNQQLQILKDFDNSTLFYLNVTEWMSGGVLASLKRAVQYESEGIMEFLPRKDLLRLPVFDSLDRQLDYRRKLSNDSVYRFRLKDSDPIQGLKGLRELSGIALQSLDSIRDIAGKRLAKYRKQQELAGLNESLTAQIDRFKAMYDSTERELPEGPYRKTVEAVYDYTLQFVEDYREIKSTELKISQAGNIIGCAENSQELILSIAEMPEYAKNIKVEYTDEVWNPFLAMTMKEIVKERILSAYQEKLIPYVLSKVQNQLSCENTSKYLRMIDAIHLRMIEIRQKDTAEIEKKLKYEDRPEKIMELLSI